MKRNDLVQNSHYELLRQRATYICDQVNIKGKTDAYALITVIKKAKSVIDSAFKSADALNKKGTMLSPSLLWIYDNYYLYDETVRKTIKNLKAQKKLPCAISKNGKFMPAYFICFYRYISETDCEIDIDVISAFVTGLEKAYRTNLSYSDFYSFGVLFSACIITKIAHCCFSVLNEADSKSHAESIGKMTSSIRFISDFSFEKFLENCHTEKILRLDPSGDYCNMTEDTKDYYRSRVAYLALKKGISEQQLAQEILENARRAEKAKEKHIGFYLYPEKSKAKGILYFSTLFLLTVFTMFFLVKLHPVCIVALFPVYELAKQISDKAFSYFTVSVPLPSLEIQTLPDISGVLTVITTVLTEDSINELFTRLENMYHSCGTKNAYFALLADFPESDNHKENSDDTLFTLANDRISALKLKYGECFFLFIRNRAFNEKENKFMGYERKRGAIDELCRYLSGKDGTHFIKNKNMPDSGVCNRIRYILTLDSDTNLPPDAVRQLAGIMLHPLNRPEIDENKGVVKGGYALLQSAVATELSAASKTLFSRIFSGAGGFEIYSFSGFELYQSVFGEGTFCGKGMFDKEAYMKCIGKDSFAFPENTVLSHDIVEGARLNTANVTDLKMTDGFPGNTVSYLKRHHRWVRGDTQNLVFLKKYVKNKGGKLIKNNISALSKYKLFDNFRRSAVPVFAYRGIIASAFLSGKASAVLFLFSIFYILYGFISDFASKVSGVGIGCAAIKYFSKNAIPGIILSFYRMLIEISMLPSIALCSINAICVSLYRMLISKRKMLEWTTASMGESLVKDSIIYYISKNMFCAVSGALLYTIFPYSYIKLIGLMWFLFPITAYLLGKVRKDIHSEATPAEKATITEYAGDIWKFFGDAVSEKTSFLPVDNIQLYPTEKYCEKTSPTNIGLYLASVLAARDFTFIDSDTMYHLLYNTFDTIKKLKKWNGHLYNWYSTKDLSVISPEVISSVDSGNFLACLICLKEGLKEYVNEKTELLEIIADAEKVINETGIDMLYDKSKKLFYIEAAIDKNGNPTYSQNHFDMLMSEARTLSYIAVAKKAAEAKHYSRLSRPLIKHSHRIGVASWTGTAFEYFMPALFMPVVKGSLIYEALRFAMYRQKSRYGVTESGKLFGISESGYYAFDDCMNYQYKAFGVPDLALKQGLDKELVISPYSSFLMMCLDRKTPLENLKRLKKERLYGKYGFYEAYDFTESRTLSAEAVMSNMSHHMGMSLLSCANAVFENVFVERFMSDAAMKSIHELLEERIPVDCVVKKISKTRNIPERRNRFRNI